MSEKGEMGGERVKGLQGEEIREGWSREEETREVGGGAREGIWAR